MATVQTTQNYWQTFFFGGKVPAFPGGADITIEIAPDTSGSPDLSAIESLAVPQATADGYTIGGVLQRELGEGHTYHARQVILWGTLRYESDWKSITINAETAPSTPSITLTARKSGIEAAVSSDLDQIELVEWAFAIGSDPGSDPVPNMMGRAITISASPGDVVHVRARALGINGQYSDWTAETTATVTKPNLDDDIQDGTDYKRVHQGQQDWQNLMTKNAGPEQFTDGSDEFIYMDKIPIEDLGLDHGDYVCLSGEIRVDPEGEEHRAFLVFRGYTNSGDTGTNQADPTAAYELDAYNRVAKENIQVDNSTNYISIAIITFDGATDYDVYGRKIMLNKGKFAVPFNEPPIRAQRESAADLPGAMDIRSGKTNSMANDTVLEGGVIRTQDPTAGGGQQAIEIRKDTNTLKFYDAEGNLIISIDDDILNGSPGIQFTNGGIVDLFDNGALRLRDDGWDFDEDLSSARTVDVGSTYTAHSALMELSTTLDTYAIYIANGDVYISDNLEAGSIKIAGTVVIDSSGNIKPVGTYKSSDGSAGVTQTVSITGASGTHTLTFKDGILTNYSAP